MAGVGCPFGSSGTGNLVVAFDEGGLKKFATVDYRLDATVSATLACGDAAHLVELLYSASDSVPGLVPDDKGHAAGSGTLQVTATDPGCAGRLLLHAIDYTDLTLTDVTTGRVYRLDPISQVFG